MTTNPQVPERDPSVAEPVNLLELVAIQLRFRRTVVGWTVGCAVVIASWTLLGPRVWTATASFVPQSVPAQAASQFSALAGRFGLSLGSVDAGQSPEFYAQLVRTDRILRFVALDTFRLVDTTGLLARGTVVGDLAELLKVEDTASDLRVHDAIKWLREDALRVSVENETGVVRLAVSTEWPDVSVQIASQIVDLVHRFNLDQRQTQARSEREFIEERLAEARNELAAAENELAEFLRNNRSFQNSPALAFEHDRRQREVMLRQEIYATLAQSYEEARISEVRNTPVLTVIEEALLSVEPARRRLALKGMLGLVMGAIIGAGVAYLQEYMRRQRQAGTADYEMVAGLWRETTRPFRFGRGRKAVDS
ncbi:MAG TPA: hypothetical protein VGA37_10730 [Gemmatimonadales bacterium]